MNDQHDAVAEEIERLANEWMTAVDQRDHATLERILGEEFRLGFGTHGFADRASWLQLALHAVEVESFGYRDVTVRTYGEVAVMQLRLTQRARLRGTDWSGEGLITDVWVHRDGRWQVIARRWRSNRSRTCYLTRTISRPERQPGLSLIHI